MKSYEKRLEEDNEKLREELVATNRVLKELLDHFMVSIKLKIKCFSYNEAEEQYDKLYECVRFTKWEDINVPKLGDCHVPGPVSEKFKNDLWDIIYDSKSGYEEKRRLFLFDGLKTLTYETESYNYKVEVSWKILE